MTEKLLTGALSLNTNKLVVLTSQSTFFSIMLGQSHRFLGINQYHRKLEVSRSRKFYEGGGVEHIAPKSDNLLLFKLKIYVDKFPKKGLTGDVFF